MLKNKKLIFTLIIVLVLGLVLGIILIVKKNSIKTNDINKDTNIEQDEKENNNIIIDGVEYIDTSRNFKDVDARNFTFYVDKEHKKNITFSYKKEAGEKEKVSLKKILNYDKSIGAVFTYNVKVSGTYGHENLEICVSDENYETPDGEKIITQNKEMIWSENGITCYVEKYKGFYTHQFIVNIDGTEVALYCSYKEKNAKIIKTGVMELINHLSVNKNVGYYLDYYLNQQGTKNVTIKSYKLIEYVSTDYSEYNSCLAINNYDIIYRKYSNFDYESTYPKLTNYKEIGNSKIGYQVYDDFVSDTSRRELYIYVYTSYIREDGDIGYCNPAFFKYRYSKDDNIFPEEIVKAVVDSLVFFNTDKK
ncbi:unknown [Clostridium sp. CAG:465]|nr:unknown [Clostridium sp. CAG:465]